MAYQQSDLDLLHQKLLQVASGPQEVQFADGRKTRFQTVEAIEAAIRVVDAQLKMQASAVSGLVRRRTPYYRSGL